MAAATRARQAGRAAVAMTAQEKFLFDLNGYIVVRGALSKGEVDAANAAIDSHISEIHPRGELRNTRPGTSLSGDGTSSRLDLGGMLGWGAPHAAPFRRLLCHPKLVPYLDELCGQGYRLDHQPMVIAQESGSEGFSLHGGPLTPSGHFNPELQYRCVNGKMWNSLLAMSVQLVDHDEGDGGFCVLPGSHKLNFPVSGDMANGGTESFRSFVRQVPTKAGDVVFFSEATVHGAMPWTAESKQRRIALYRFSPPTLGYGRAYLEDFGLGPAQLEELSPAERAVMGPPYANRLDRPVIVLTSPSSEANDSDRSVEPPTARDVSEEAVPVATVPAPRNPAKKAFDKSVFNTSYF